MLLKKAFVLSALFSSVAFAGDYSRLGTINLYSQQFEQAVDTPTYLKNKLGKNEYAYDHSLALQSSFAMSDMDSFIDEIDLLDAEMKRSGLTQSDATNIINDFDGVLENLGSAKPISFNSKISLPYMPVAFKYRRQYFSLFFDVSAGAQADFMDAPLTFNSVNGELETSSAVRIKSYTHSRIGLNYSIPLIVGNKFNLNAGIRGVAHHMSLYKEVRSLNSVDKTGISESIFDDYSDEVNSTTKYSVDASLRFENRNSALVLGVRNLTEPVFQYNSVSSYCSDPTSGLTEDCISATAFVASGEMRNAGEIKLMRQGFIQGTYNIANTGFGFSGYIETNRVRNMFKNWEQIGRAEVSYESSSSYFSGMFLGYETNLAETTSRKYVAGLSFFNRIKLSGFSSNDLINVEGERIPSEFGFSVSLNTEF